MSETPRPERCETCRFWEKDPISNCGPPQLNFDDYPGSDDGWIRAGECRRLPPPLTRDPDAAGWPENAQGAWPVTLPLDWCGEWRQDTPALGGGDPP